MSKNPLITFDISHEYIVGFLAGFETSTKAIFNNDAFNAFNSKIKPILDTRFSYHMMMGNHLLGDWSNYSDEQVLLKITDIGNVYGDMFAEQLVAFINANDIRPIKTPSDIETKTKNGNDSKSSHFENTTASNSSSSFNEFGGDEIAPITSNINQMNTPSTKNSTKSDTSNNSSLNSSNDTTEANTRTENENINRTNFENSMKMVEFYLEKGNIFAVMLECMVDKCVYERNVIF